MKIRLRPKLSLNRYAAWLFVLLFFMEPPSYVTNSSNSLLHEFMLAGEYMSYIYILIKFVNRRRHSTAVLLSLVLYGIIIVSTWYNSGNVLLSVRYSMGFVFMVMLTANEIDQIDLLWRTIISYMTIMLTINLITVFLFPEGMFTTYSTYMGQRVIGQNTWFYANKNGVGKYCIYVLTITSLHEFKRSTSHSLLFFYLAVISIATVVLVWSATSVVTVILLAILLTFVPLISNRKPKAFNILYFLIILIVLFFAVVVMQNAEAFNYIIQGILKKNITFNGRTPIWSSALYLIYQKPILGYGYMSGVNTRALLGYQAASDAHNLFLSLLLYGGALCLAVFFVVLGFVIRNVKRTQYSYDGIILSAFIFSFYLMCLFENTSSTLYWAILTYGLYMRETETREIANDEREQRNSIDYYSSF